jgi:hypothetical protein
MLAVLAIASSAQPAFVIDDHAPPPANDGSA